MSTKRKRWPVPVPYRTVARMSGQELLDELTAPQRPHMATLLRVEMKLRLVDGLKRRRR